MRWFPSLVSCAMILVLFGCTAIVGGKLDNKSPTPDGGPMCTSAADCPGVESCNVACDPSSSLATSQGCVTGNVSPDGTSCGGSANQRCVEGECRDLTPCMVDLQCPCTHRCMPLPEEEGGVCVLLPAGAVRESGDEVAEFCTDPPDLLGVCVLGLCRHECSTRGSGACRCDESCTDVGEGRICYPMDRNRLVGTACFDDDTGMSDQRCAADGDCRAIL